jgi:ADP-heptose:LPS heptosyltransferase
MREERILVVQLRQLGDILLTTPCLRAIKRERPKARVTFLSHAMGRLVLDHCPYLDEHFVYGSDWSWRQEWGLAATLRERRFDLVLDFMGNPRSAFYSWRTGATERLSYTSARRFLYTATIPPAAGPCYIVREKFMLLRAAGFLAHAAGDPALVLPWFEGHTQPFMRFYATHAAVRDAPLKVGLSPTHRRPARRWPLARWAELATRLSAEWQAAVIWLWGPGEEALIDEAMALTAERSHAPTFKAPATSFREMAALIGNLDLFIGNSNGLSHVAVAGDVPSLQLHGPTEAASWSPLTARHRALQSPEWATRRDQARIDLIGVDDVWSALAAMRGEIDAYAAAAKGKRPRLAWR